MNLLDFTPAFDQAAAAAIAASHFDLRATARRLPGERDQNFLLTNAGGEKFVLKISNALESRSLLEAQNAVLQYLSQCVSFCPDLVASTSGDLIVALEGPGDGTYFVRLVQYLDGTPLAKIHPHTSGLLEDLGKKLGQLSRALADFDHPATHRDFHWDLANGTKIIAQYATLIDDKDLQDQVRRCTYEPTIELQRSVIHGDANDYNILVDPGSQTVSGLIDFGDLLYSYRVADLAIAIAYVVLEKPDPLAAATSVVKGYTSEAVLSDDELETLWPLARLRLAMSVCHAAHQLQEQPDNEYLRISQRAIRESLPRLLDLEPTWKI